MTALILLLVLLVIASATDIATHHISNRLTYPGILLGLLCNAAGLGVLGNGWDGLLAGLLGFLGCGFLVLAAFVFFEIGGGDVKLIAMLGAFLGVEAGIEALLWTFSVGFVCGVSIVIWQAGFTNLVRRGIEHLALVAKARGWVPLTPAERQPLQRGLFLAPSALVAAVIVSWPTLVRPYLS